MEASNTILKYCFEGLRVRVGLSASTMMSSRRRSEVYNQSPQRTDWTAPGGSRGACCDMSRNMQRSRIALLEVYLLCFDVTMALNLSIWPSLSTISLSN
jgi:hypothetical protein